MNAFIKLFLDICLFRRGPQDVPDSRLLFGLVLFSDIVVSSVVGMQDGDVVGAILQALTASALLLLFVAGVLWLTTNFGRFGKTSIAVLGCDALITLVALPISIMAEAVSGLGLLLLGVLIWNLLVFAHILKNALGVGYGLSVALALMYTLTSLDLMARIFSE